MGNGDFDPLYYVHLKPLKILLQKLDIVSWYATHHAKFCGNRPTGVHPQNSSNIRSCEWLCDTFLTNPFVPFFLVVAYSKTTDVSYRSMHQTTRFQSPLLRWQNLSLIFNEFIRKKSTKIQWRLWGKFKNSFNCHNSGCPQYRVIILGSRV